MDSVEYREQLENRRDERGRSAESAARTVPVAPLEALLDFPHWTYIDGVLTAVVLPEAIRSVLAAHPADAPAGPEPDPFLAEIRAAVDAADRDAPQRCGHSSEPMCCPFENFPTLAAWFRQATADAPAEGRRGAWTCS